jgi:hypothetical protein
VCYFWFQYRSTYVATAHSFCYWQISIKKHQQLLLHIDLLHIINNKYVLVHNGTYSMTIFFKK